MPEPGFLSIGQPVARRLAQRAARGGRVQRTLLVHGPAGAAKEAFVDDLLAMLFCQATEVDRRPCNACRGCADARRRQHPDLVIGSPDAWRAGRGTGESIVAAARRWLLEAAGAPVVAERRIVLIERADRANEQTQNALLKALEEPTVRHMFVLVADEPSRLLPTIRSRAQTLRLGPVGRAELAGWLTDREGLPADQADVLARISNGLAGTAIAYARRPELVAWRRQAQGELLDLVGRGRAERFAAVRELLDAAGRIGEEAPTVAEEESEPGGGATRLATAAQRAAAQRIVDVWTELARDMLVAAGGRPELAPASEILAELSDVAGRIGPAPLAAFLHTLDRVHDGIEQNAAPRLALEAAMLDWPS
jgi:DNA polymerase-3 subunit delta'